MADAMIGFGIGLSGTPKDYTSIVAARQRQKQLGELEEKKQKKSLLDPVMKSIAVDKNLYMDYRIPEVREKTAEFVTKAQQAAESSDINALAMAQQEYNTYVQQMVAERKMFDEDLKNYEAGTALMVKDPRLLRQAKTLEEARKLAEENPDDFFVSEYGTVSAKPIKPLNIQSFYQKAADDLRTGEAVPTQIIINGKPATVMVRPIDKQQFEDRMRTDFRSNQGIQQTTRVNFTLEGGDLKGLSPVEKAKKLEDYYVQQGAVYLGRDPQNVFREGKGMSFSFNMGGDQTEGIGDITKNNITVSRNLEGGGKADFPVSNVDSYTTRKWSSVAAKATDARDYRTGYPLKTGVKDYTFGEISVLPVYKQDYVGLLGRVKDQIVGDKELERDKKAGRVVYKVFAIGTANQNKRIVDVYVPANQVIGGLSGVLNDKQKVKQDENYREMQRLADEYNNAMGQPSAPASTTRTAAPTQRTSTPAPKAGGTEPATGGTGKYSKYKR
jgi:hypothetical protein